MENIIYYYVVFTIVIMVKLHKHLKQETPDIPLSPDDPYKWLDIFDGMDLAFSAAGVIITLFLNSESKYYPASWSNERGYPFRSLADLSGEIAKFTPEQIKNFDPTSLEAGGP